MTASKSFRWDRVSLVVLSGLLLALVLQRLGATPGAEDWLSRLAVEDPEQVAEAVSGLTALGEVVIPRLVEEARSNPRAAAAATRVLVAMPSPVARQRLVLLALAGDGSEAEHQARVALAALGEQGVEALSPLLLAEPVNEGVRAAVLQALSINQSVASTDALISALANQPAPVRAVAVEVLVERSGERCSKALARVGREDESAVLREIAVLGLGERADMSVLADLLKALTDPDLSVRYASASAIEQLGDKRAITGLVDALDVLDLDNPATATPKPGEAVDRHVLGIRIALCLKKLSGIEHGVQVLAWRAWLEQESESVGPQLPSPF